MPTRCPSRAPADLTCRGSPTASLLCRRSPSCARCLTESRINGCPATDCCSSGCVTTSTTNIHQRAPLRRHIRKTFTNRRAPKSPSPTMSSPDFYASTAQDGPRQSLSFAIPASPRHRELVSRCGVECHSNLDINQC